MSGSPTLRVGLVGTSWWAEAMYLPALADHPIGRITALCGRDPDRTADVAGRWEIPQHFTDWGIMLDKAASRCCARSHWA